MTYYMRHDWAGNKARMEQMHANNFTNIQMASHLGCSVSTVQYWLRKFGMVKQKRRLVAPPLTPVEELEDNHSRDRVRLIPDEDPLLARLEKYHHGRR